MKIVPIYLLVLPLILAACSKVDNYDAPNATIKGSVIDNVTHQPIQSEAPNGFFIRLEENRSNTIPLNFNGRADGTFENAAVFSGSYKVVPILGAFFTPDTAVVNVSGVTNVDFTVTPFLSIAATAKSVSGGAEVTFSLSRSVESGKIKECRALASLSPSVSSVVFNKDVTTDLSGSTDEDILTTQFTQTITGLDAGQTYYVRVAARTDNSSGKYNYSEIIPITVQ